MIISNLLECHEFLSHFFPKKNCLKYHWIDPIGKQFIEEPRPNWLNFERDMEKNER